MKKISMLTMYDEKFKLMGSIAASNKRPYCAKHNYNYFESTQTLDPTRPIPWSKIVMIYQHLPKNDWIYWSDADSLIMNTEIKLESIIDENYDVIIVKDFFGNINSGSFLIKNSEWSKNYLNQIYNCEQFINHVFWENAAIIYLYQTSEDVRKHTKIVDSRVMNSFVNNYENGDFVIHFAGIATNRELLMEAYLKIVK